jgi:putative peptidoglycan lipid II flippase
MALSQPLVGLILGGGQFDDIAVQFTGTALFHFAIGAVGFGVLTILSRACYAMLDGRTPIIAAVAAIIANAVLSFTLAPHLDVAGPALANAAAQTLGASILVVSLTRKGVIKWPVSTIADLGKMIAIALVMFGAVYVTAHQTAGIHVLLQVAVPGTAGVIVYLGLAAVLRIKEMSWAISLFKRR